MSQDNTTASAATTQEAPASTPEQSVQEVMETIDSANGVDQTEEQETQETEQTPEEQEKAEKAAVQEMKKRLKLKVDGREVEEEIDFNNEDYLREMLQKGKSADSKFQKASQMEKEMKQLIKLFQEDPYEALMRMGHDPDLLAEKRIEQKIKELEKSPEQIEREKLQKELEKERKIREKLEQEKLDAEKARVAAEYSRKLDTEITEALASSKLPKSPYVVKRLAENLMQAMRMGYDDVSVKDVLPVVEKQIHGEIQQMFGAMPEDVIEQILGQDVSDKLRKRRLNKMKAAPESTVKATGTAETKAKAAASEKPKPIDPKDFWKKLGDY